MKFRFRRSLDDNVVPPVTLVLKTEDPLLYRIGAAEDYQPSETRQGRQEGHAIRLCLR